MNQQLSAKAANFQEFLSSRGIEGKVVELSESTRTSAEAAAAIGCEVEEIAKSIVFYVKDTPSDRTWCCLLYTSDAADD